MFRVNHAEDDNGSREKPPWTNHRRRFLDFENPAAVAQGRRDFGGCSRRRRPRLSKIFQERRTSRS